MKVHCAHDKLVDVSELKAHPKNRNDHPADQIVRLAKILEYQGWRYPVKVSKQSGFITSGHGRVLAAKHLGWKQVPVNFQEYENEEQEYADIVSDNSIASWSELDLSAINSDIVDLGPDFDIDLLGIKDFVIEPADKESPETDLYTNKIKAPVYEPKGEKPKTTELYDLAKTMELMAEIGGKNIPEDIRVFLEFAAHRHIVFNYEKIAEFYAHAPREVQELMENSALVIIDFKKAIEKGFVVMTDEMAEAYEEQ